MYLRDGRLELAHKALAFKFAAAPVRDVLIDDDCPNDIPGGISQGEGRVENRLARPIEALDGPSEGTRVP